MALSRYANQRKKHPDPPLDVKLEVYPKICGRCGKKVTQVGGCVDRYTRDGGWVRFHKFADEVPLEGD